MGHFSTIGVSGKAYLYLMYIWTDHYIWRSSVCGHRISTRDADQIRLGGSLCSPSVFTTLHGMHTRSSNENSVCPSVRPSIFLSV